MGILSLQLAAGELVEKIQRHLNIDLNCPKRKQISLPSIHFPRRSVSFREGIFNLYLSHIIHIPVTALF